MKTRLSYITLLCTLLFSVTFVPFNLLHHHAEDEHTAALLYHQVSTKHHCELDNQYCQTQYKKDCGHQSHIEKPITKCFFCDFHFIKHIECSMCWSANEQYSSTVLYASVLSVELTDAFVLLINKGPPTLG